MIIVILLLALLLLLLLVKRKPAPRVVEPLAPAPSFADSTPETASVTTNSAEFTPGGGDFGGAGSSGSWGDADGGGDGGD